MEFSDELLEKASDCMAQIMEEEAYRINEYYFLHKDEIEEQFTQMLAKLYGKWTEEYTDEEKPLSLNITYLLSSMVTETYEFLFSLYGEEGYFDEKQKHVYWNPYFITQSISDSVKVLERKIYNSIPFIEKYEMRELLLLFKNEYVKLFNRFVLENIALITEQEAFLKLEKCEGFQITAGGLYDEQQTLYEYESVQEVE